MAELVVLAALSGATTTIALAAQAADPTMGIAPYVGGGAGVIAVGALVEVTRRLLNGRLIPRETKDYEEELGAAIVASGQREATVIGLAEGMRGDSARSAALVAKALEDNTRALDDLRRAVEGRL